MKKAKIPECPKCIKNWARTKQDPPCASTDTCPRLDTPFLGPELEYCLETYWLVKLTHNLPRPGGLEQQSRMVMRAWLIIDNEIGEIESEKLKRTAKDVKKPKADGNAAGKIPRGARTPR